VTGKRVVYIKVPIVPFSLPVAVPPQIDEVAETKKNLHVAKRKKKQDKLRKRKKHVSFVGKILFKENNIYI
jgi:hypothetical protein